MNDQDTPNTQGPTARTGIMIGILAAVLLLLAFYFVWRSTGYRDLDTGRRPVPPATEVLPR